MRKLIFVLLMAITGNVIAMSESKVPKELSKFMHDNFAGKFKYKKEPFGYVAQAINNGHKIFVTADKQGKLIALDREMSFKDLPESMQTQYGCVKVTHIILRTDNTGSREYQIQYKKGAFEYYVILSESTGITTYRENAIVNKILGSGLLVTIVLLFMSTR